MRRIVSVIGSFLLVIAVAGCGTSDDEPPQDTTSVEDNSAVSDTIDEDSTSPVDAVEDTTLPEDTAVETDLPDSSNDSSDTTVDLGVEDVPAADIVEDIPVEDVPVEDVAVEDVPIEGACNNDSDLALLMENDPSGTMQQCGMSCIGAGGDCILDCIKEGTEFSDDCAVCFAGVTTCIMANCITQCAGGDSTACDTCRIENCGPAFETCSGIPIN